MIHKIKSNPKLYIEDLKKAKNAILKKNFEGLGEAIGDINYMLFL